VDRDEAKRILDSTASEFDRVFTQWNELGRQMEGLRQIKAGLLKVYPDLVSEPPNPLTDEDVWTGDKPKGASAVGVVLAETPGKWFSVSMMVRELDRRGWLPESDNPANATRAALERLIAANPDVRKDTGTKTGQVVYAYKGRPGSSTDETFQSVNGVPMPGAASG
jgi:hypothetical protein